MFPLLPLGLAFSARILTSGNKIKPLFKGKKIYIKPKRKENAKKYRIKPGVNPIQKLLKGLNSTISSITSKSNRANEDYNSIVQKFMPENAKLLSPKYPIKSGAIQFLDVDGDSENELITSFRMDNQVNTIVLKKQNGEWNNICNISSNNFDGLHYRGAADITGEGKKQLLIGLTSGTETPELHGYTLTNGSANKVFNQSYHKVEILPVNERFRKKEELAIWSRKEADKMDINVFGWNGQQLETSNNATAYHSKKAVPYFAQRLKESPYKTSNWYNLAHSLVKAGEYRDASSVIEVGMKLDNKSTLKNEFEVLKEMCKK